MASGKESSAGAEFLKFTAGFFLLLGAIAVGADLLTDGH
jgi:hypothetical protein